MDINTLRKWIAERDSFSILETIDVHTGARTVLREFDCVIEAPNWTRDGRFLVYNSRGRIYTYELATRGIREIDSGLATDCNNDHVLSFDGTMLGISDQSAPGGQSAIHTLPAAGGAPKRVTPLTPSDLHGWSPDGKWLVYTGGRANKYDIYKIASDGSGAEIRLTDSPGLNDGPEFTPDGEHIYFNSSRSGSMQIWRMKPDGTNQEAVTNDEYNNWFPHISPDGKWMVLLSYSKDVAPTDHPYYQHVYLRLMPVAGGAAKVIAYVYGGQGTINVPSWSPDSQRIAFVSNSDL